jgi:tRNA1(Val) A37 N6-methylase TrmN6
MRSRPAEASEFSFAVTDDAVLGGRLKLLQPERGHRAGHDAILLAAAAAANARHAIDLGAGVGTAGLALLARGTTERVTLVEIDAELATLARANAERNGYGDRVEVVCADVAEIGRGDSADLVLMNPPFNDPARTQSSPDPRRRRAHVGNDADLAVWIDAAHRLLKQGGKLVLIHRPEARPAILAAFEDRFGAAELIPIFPKPGAAAIRLIVRAAKGKRAPPAIRAGFVLADKEGRPTPEAEAVLRGAQPFDPA